MTDNYPINKRLITLILIGLFFVSVGVFIRTPTYDDGVHATTVRNTIGLKNPFYNNYEKVQHPFQRIQFGILALGYNYFFPFNFRWPSFIHAILLCTSTIFVYLISRRYQNKEISYLVASLYFYFVFTMYWISPTRPEIWLSTIYLYIILLGEWFMSSNKIKYIIIASIVIGMFGLTFHSNSWILYIYIILFMVFNRNILSSKNIKVILISLSLSTLVGLSVIFLPKPHEALDFLLNMTQEGGNRLQISWNKEITRFSNFILNPHHKYLSYIFTILIILWVYDNRKNFISLQTTAFNKYGNIYLCLFASFIGLGILPSARWFVYLAYYYFPILFMVSIIYSNTNLTKIRMIFFKVCIYTLFLRFCIIKISNGQLFQTDELIKLLIYYLPLVILTIFWPKFKIKLLFSMLILGMFHQTFLMYKRNVVLNEVSEYYINHSKLRILANPEFDWVIFHDDNIWDLMRNKSNKLNQGYFLVGDNSSWAQLFLKGRSCKFSLQDSIIKSFDNIDYLPINFRRLEVYNYECYDSLNDPLTMEISLKDYIRNQNK